VSGVGRIFGIILIGFFSHVLNCLVQNEPGVLSRVSGILAGRGFNIESLVVCRTEIRDLSRMTIVLKGQDGVVEQARRQLEDLVSSFGKFLRWRGIYDPG
jgi:acetolactate synthase small subunit